MLLHSLFGTYFDSLSQQANTNMNMHKIERLGAQFLRANCLVHELAHCLNQYPELKCVKPDGTFFKPYANKEEADELNPIMLPECGLFWERSIFNKQVVRFVEFVTARDENEWTYQSINDLIIPNIRNFHITGRSGTSQFNTGEKNSDGKIKEYQTTSAFDGYQKTL
jgi:hypothetical protein